jgi:hypothetical protein
VVLNVLGSNVPSIVDPLPFGIIPFFGESSQYQLTDEAYDFAIGGIPFLSGESLRGTYFRRMFIREFADIRKSQFDNQQVPGEQSILGWWLRSQSNFSQGGGVQYLDTTVDQTLGQRYYYSEHIDTLSIPGNVQLTQATKQILSSVNTNLKLRGVSSGGVDLVLVADGAVLKQINNAGTVTSYTMPAGITSIVSLVDDGTSYYFVDSAGAGIFKGTIGTTGVAATKIWTTTGSRHVLGFVKGRLVYGGDNNIYELVGSGPTLPTPKFSHFNTSYTFTAITAVPSAIMVGGFAGAMSQIHKFTLDSGGAMPTLTSGVVTAEMPYGETINDLYGYISTFVAIATNKGLRIATTDTNGNLVYGPLVFQNANGVNTLSGYDRFIICDNANNLLIPQQGFQNPNNATNTSMLVRVDMSQSTSTGGQPYCSDIDSHFQGTVLDTCNFGTSNLSAGMLVMSVSGQGVFMTDTTKKESTGFLLTSRIRFNTLEEKHFKEIFLRTQSISDGSITVAALDPGGGNTNIITQAAGTTTGPAMVGPEGDSREWLQFQFTFTRGTTSLNVSPVMNGYQVRALPGVDRQLLITVPLSCHDFEEDKFGNPVGYDGSAQARIQALEALIQSGDLVTFQDLNYRTADLVIADNYRFEQQANEQPKSSSQGQSDGNSRGGYIIVQLRVVG